ncbi:rCG63634 [Rattus norvegicus]|uniref:RCG63634 n=1 Tax=Rattus norvegicus TaxID=10116 RepID=A6I0L8_RAT|nr:rCG63634 [Rattus norvegicus]
MPRLALATTTRNPKTSNGMREGRWVGSWET